MSATSSTSSTGTGTAGERARRPRADLRHLERMAAAVLMPIGPAAVAALRFLYVDPATGHVDPRAQQAVLWLGVVGLFTLLPGAYAALKLLKRSAPRLAAWSGAFLIPGYLAMPALLAVDAFAAVAPGVRLDAATEDRILDALMALPHLSVLVLVFVVGHVVGTLLLGVAMIAGRAAPLVVGVLMTVSQPLHLTAVIIGNPTLDLLAWGLTAVGMGFLAIRVLRTPDDQWDLPPRRR